MNERYIYGKLNKEVKPVNYEGEPTDTIEVHVDNDKRTIRADYVGPMGDTYVGGTTETAEVHINDADDEKVITVDVIGGGGNKKLHNHAIGITYNGSGSYPFIFSNLYLPTNQSLEGETDGETLENIANAIMTHYLVDDLYGIESGFVGAYGLFNSIDLSKRVTVIGLHASLTTEGLQVVYVNDGEIGYETLDPNHTNIVSDYVND